MHKLAFSFRWGECVLRIVIILLDIPAGRDMVDFATSPKFDLMEPVKFKINSDSVFAIYFLILTNGYYSYLVPQP
jgi:hypothetical protein